MRSAFGILLRMIDQVKHPTNAHAEKAHGRPLESLLPAVERNGQSTKHPKYCPKQKGLEYQSLFVLPLFFINSSG